MVGPERVLMQGYLDIDRNIGTAAPNNFGTVAVTGLPTELADNEGRGFDVYVYYLGCGDVGRVASHTIGATTQFAAEASMPAGLVESDGTAADNQGTYIVFSGLSGTSFTLSSQGVSTPNQFRALINAIQIVAVPPPAPPSE